MGLNRRQILCGLGGIACGAACAGLINPKEDAHAASEKMQRFQQAGGNFGWKPHKLDVEAVQKVAYEAYHNKGYACGYGVFYSIVGSLAEQYGAPYNQFPFSMLEVFKGGISDWGTICGCLGGAASAYALFWGRKERDAMVDELFHWYSTTNLPIYNPADAKVSLDKTKPTIAESQLCHISVSRWCAANGIGEKSKERSERCARLTADTAGRACEIFNAKIEKGKDWKGTYVAPESVKKCADECHKKPGSGSDWAKGHMDCKPCHDGGKALQNHYVNHP